MQVVLYIVEYAVFLSHIDLLSVQSKYNVSDEKTCEDMVKIDTSLPYNRILAEMSILGKKKFTILMENLKCCAKDLKNIHTN